MVLLLYTSLWIVASVPVFYSVILSKCDKKDRLRCAAGPFRYVTPQVSPQ